MLRRIFKPALAICLLLASSMSLCAHWMSLGYDTTLYTGKGGVRSGEFIWTYSWALGVCDGTLVLARKRLAGLWDGNVGSPREWGTARNALSDQNRYLSYNLNNPPGGAWQLDAIFFRYASSEGDRRHLEYGRRYRSAWLAAVPLWAIELILLPLTFIACRSAWRQRASHANGFQL